VRSINRGSKALLALVALFFGLVSLTVAADLTREISFNIPQQPLAQALAEFSRQSDVIIAASSEITAGKTSKPINTTTTAAKALQLLLEGSKLVYTQDKDGSIVIKRPGRTTRDADPPAAPLASSNPSNSSPSSQESEGKKDEELNGSSPSKVVLEEVIVTGSHIRGEVPVGSSLKVYTREDIEESGAATLDQFGRDMPENFSDTDMVSNIASNVQSAKFTNGGGGPFAAAAFDLHGLGAAATLTLLNGHRVAGASFNGSFVDISLLPLSIVDRIEVLPDGASAIYGADAVAGVVNIITRKDFDGAESSVRYGGATEGGAGEFTGSQLLGHSWSGGNVLLSYEYDKQDGLDVSRRDYIGSQGGPTSLLPQNRRNSVFISGSQELGANTTIFGDAIYSDRDHVWFSTLAGDYFGAPIVSAAVGSGTTKQTGLSITVDHTLPGNWHADLTGNYSRILQADTELQNFISGGSDETSDTFTSGNSDEAGLDALATGPLIDLPGGAVKVALGASYRWEKFFGAFDESFSGDVFHFGLPRSLQRDVTSLYGELLLPVVSQSNAVLGISRLEISASGRYDKYTDFGSTSNPKIGVLWEVVTGFDFRGTYGTSFQAPNLDDLGLTVNSGTELTPDPSSATGATDTLFLNGGNPKLTPERSRSFSVGFDLKPSLLPHFSFSATYFHVEFTDRIALPPVVGETYLSDPALIPFVIRNPPLALVESYFDSPGFSGDQVGSGPAGVKAIFDDRYANIATTKESGLDFTTSYAIPTDFGQFTVSLAADRIFENTYQPSPGGQFTALLNTFGQTPKFKARGGIAWAQGGFGALLTINYVNSYDNPLVTPTERIDAWTTANLNLSYKVGTSANSYLLRNMTIALNVQNIADRKPPYVNVPNDNGLTGANAIPFDPANASPVGRLIALQLTKRF
jgi:iron complex outermembrane receptor protein